VIALGKAEGVRLGIPLRVYTPITHPGNLVMFEYQFADLAEQARFWAAYNADPEALAFQAQLRALVEREHRKELYQVL
jgi:hypothetical protein